jgi:hypothetical protein
VALNPLFGPNGALMFNIVNFGIPRSSTASARTAAAFAAGGKSYSLPRFWVDTAMLGIPSSAPSSAPDTVPE